MRTALFIAAALVAASPAAADTIWDRVTAEADDPDARYAAEMQRARDYLDLALNVGFREKQLLLDKVERAYQNAIAARPDAAEPHYHLAELGYRRYLVESGSIPRGPHGEAILRFDRKVAKEVLHHWDEFERKAPLDPRITEHVLSERALVHTKMGTEEHYQKALDDYQVLLDRFGILHDAFKPLVLYNAAEILMMLGRLDDAIGLYDRTLRRTTSREYVFSMAVALDRAGQGTRAREILSRYVLDENDLDAIVGRDSTIFFVPTGELYYYLGIGWEVLGDPDQAMKFYDLFIRSGAHPRFQPRAREHLERLRKERTGR